MKVSPDWTEEDYEAAVFELFRESTGFTGDENDVVWDEDTDRYADPAPAAVVYTNWQHVNYLEVLDDEHQQLLLEEDDKLKGLVLFALYICCWSDCPIPAWLAEAFIEDYVYTVGFFKHTSWDQVWGKPHGPEFRPTRQRSRIMDSYKIAIAVYELQQLGMSMDDELWEEAAKRLAPLTAGYIRDVYYAPKLNNYPGLDIKKLFEHITRKDA